MVPSNGFKFSNCRSFGFNFWTNIPPDTKEQIIYFQNLPPPPNTKKLHEKLNEKKNFFFNDHRNPQQLKVHLKNGDKYTVVFILTNNYQYLCTKTRNSPLKSLTNLKKFNLHLCSKYPSFTIKGAASVIPSDHFSFPTMVAMYRFSTVSLKSLAGQV